MGQRINIYAAFTGLTFIPAPFAVASNSFNPKLVLHDDHIECRVLRTSRICYDQLAHVDVLFFYKTNNLILTRPNSIFTFVANFVKADRLIEVVRFLEEKGCPLTNKALSFIKAG